MKQPVSERSAGQSICTLSAPRDWRHPLWLGLLMAASVVFSLGLACAVPLAGFAAAAAPGVVAILATLVGQWMTRRLANARPGFTLTATFLAAFVVYEGTLFTVWATLLGGTEIYTAAIQGRIFAINAAAFVGLLVLNQLATSVGLANRPALTIKEQPA